MAATPLALPIFAITLFVSAFLLFLVQPMIGKMILPSLGGTPQVWNTCQMFFQTALLAGYAYTHTVSTRLKLRSQILVHCILLFVPLALLFLGSFNQNINFWFNNAPPSGGNPIAFTLFILLMVVGLPFFVVSTSAPLLQKWFTYTGHPAAKDPYFLYGASNLGSMLSLVFYPAIVERTFTLSEQSWVWTGGYAALVILFLVCVGLVLKAPPSVQLPSTEPKPEEKPQEKVEEEKKPETSTAITAKKPAGTHSLSQRIKKGGKQKTFAPAQKASTGIMAREPRRPYIEVRSDVMTPFRRLRWVALAAVPSSLMLGIITYISTDVSAIAMFWVIPLALYLLSFILVFSRWPVVWTGQPHTLMVISFPIVFVCFLMLWLTGQINPVYRSILFAMLAFFMTAMVCHGELARDRPSPKHLTEFYLMMSLGGMIGGVFNGLFAPIIFWGLAELPIALGLACFLRPYMNKLAPVDKPVLIGFCAGLGLLMGWAFFGSFLGVFLGLVIGAGVGAVINFDDQETNGWIDTMMVKLFPGLGEWFDEKGKEMAAEAQGTVTSSTPEEEEPKKRIVKQKTAPDYYVLNYTLDVGLAIAVALVMMLLSQNSRHLINGTYYVVGKVLGMGEPMSSQIAVNLGRFFLPYGVPMICAMMFSFRPLRFGLTITAVLALTATTATQQEGREVLERGRSYFGILKVLRDPGKGIWDRIDPKEFDHPDYQRIYKARQEELKWINVGVPDKDKATEGEDAPYHYLMHGTTHHGLNFQSPKGLRRLATTYYHRKGPVGMVMEKFNWFSASPKPADNSIAWPNWEKGEGYAPQDTYRADNRLPATFVSMGLSLNGFSVLPTEQLVSLWTEPPYACVGLGTGTMASYARPLQHMTFYEIDQKIREFNLGEFELKEEGTKGPYFNYLYDAIYDRGAGIEIVMGDARLSMKKEIEAYRQKLMDDGTVTPDMKYREFLAAQYRENYYFAIELDAFSSDAIPVHLITKEAIVQYFDKMVPQGVLLVHTSNRHVELVKPVTDICKDLGKVYRVCNDHGEKIENYKNGYTICSGERGHFQSEYVIVANKVEDLPEPIKEPTSKEMVKKYYNAPLAAVTTGPYQIWQIPPAPGNRIWTDDYTDLLGVFRWGFGRGSAE